MGQHRQSNGSHTHQSQYDGTIAALRYHETLFESVNLRVISLEKRMQNIINLVCNIQQSLNQELQLTAPQTELQSCCPERQQRCPPGK